MKISVHPSALKHGLTPTQVVAAWGDGGPLECWLDDSEPQRRLRIGFDATTGLPIELVGLVFDRQRVLIIHAMPARPQTIRIAEGRSP